MLGPGSARLRAPAGMTVSGERSAGADPTPGVMPTKVGIHATIDEQPDLAWIPACAGMTAERVAVQIGEQLAWITPWWWPGWG